ncbi:MAG TPA: MauE/DoxX family redox-associated membrane protein [Solirubrobacteraceae bacterium]|nr:MauE/DoxX family redox-associated membrane protein [Solirubrobacteraceae bacterium]
MHTALLAARVVLAGVFALASVTKLADLRGSRAAVVGFGIPERVAAPLGTALPFAELAIAAALLPASSARVGALGAGALLAVFIVAIARSMARGEAPDCHCFGQLHSAPAGRRTLARNLGLAALAAFVAAAGWGDAMPSATGWIGRLDGAGVVAVAGGLAIAVLAGVTAWALLALLRQNGRMLLRIEALEAELDPAAAARPAPPHQGLPLGEPAPAFSLAGLYGESVTLESLISADTPVMLVFTDPACGPCSALMPQIATWQRELAGELTIAVLTRGSPQDNRAKAREHGIAGVWLDHGLTVYNAYSAQGTPGAVLIDGHGRIASDVVAGVEAIAALVEVTTRTPSLPVVHVPARQTALALGAPAPALELADLTGAPVELAVPDRDTLVLFWNPDCGFCERMLDDVRDFERTAPPEAPRLLLVSTGSQADNERLGLRAPIALDHAFAAGAAFGSTGTPSAVLIDRHGRVASELALGAPSVMALAGTASEIGA